MTAQTLADGYTMRPPAPEDAASVADLLNAVEMDIMGTPDSSEALVRWQWEGPGVDLGGDHRVVVTSTGQVVGYVEYEAYEPYDQLSLDGYVHPDHTGTGVGSALVDWVEDRARADVARAQAEARVVLRHFLWARDARGRAFFEARDWGICRWFYNMLIELDAEVPEPGAIGGIQIRTLRPDQERALWEADDEAFRDHWGYATEPFDEWRYRHLGKADSDPDLVFLAMDGDQIAGYAVAYPTREDDPKKGWVQILGVRRPWRRRGIGLALLRSAFRALAERGCERAGLGVDAENPLGAVALYEKAGMRVDREAVSYERELRPAGG